MVKRSMGQRKLTPEVRRRLAEMAAEARELVCGETGIPEWGILFAEIEDDAKWHIRLLMEQSAGGQAEALPAKALTTDSKEVAQAVGSRKRTLETESGGVSWTEPKAYLPRSRKDFFPSLEGPRIGD